MRNSRNGTAFDSSVSQARATPIEHEIARRGIHLAGMIDKCGPCPVCGGIDRFSINVIKSVWNCRRCGRGGDVIELVRFLDGCTFIEACATLVGNNWDAESSYIKNIAEQEQRSKDDDYKRRQWQKARYLYGVSSTASGTPVETYLRCRGITMALPSNVRYLPPRKLEDHPAMIVPFGLPTEPEPGVLEIGEDAVFAVQLTLLKPDGTGKASIQRNKITIASPAGMPIVLAPMNDSLGLAISEGVEDALTVLQATGLGSWASGGAAFMPKLVAAIDDLMFSRELGTSPECATIYAHNDEAGRRGARKLADALVERGIDVFVNGIPP